MTVTVPFTLEEETKLIALAEGQGVSPDIFVKDVVKEALDRRPLPVSTQPSTTPRRFALRQEIIAAGIPLLTDDQLRDEIRERKGHRGAEPEP